jgi:hypothetical protein
VTNGKKDRQSLIRKARCGEISSDDAEAEAKRLGLGPLARKSKEADFDPMSEPWWTLPMAMAWIVWRRLRVVLVFWDKYRLECWDWRSLQHHAEPDARTVYHLVQRRPATLGMLLRLERDLEARAEEDFVKGQMSCETARAELWRALQEGTLQATGINFDSGRRVRIPDLEWHDLESIEEEGRDVVRARSITVTAKLIKRTPRRGITEKQVAQPLQGRDDVDPTSRSAAPGYANVLVRRTEIRANWPSHEPAPTDAAAGRLKATEPAPTKASRHGAPQKYNWAAIETFVSKLMDKKGEFRESDIGSGWRTRADLERRVLEYFEDQVTRNILERSPGESTVRQKVATFLAKWRSTQKASKGQ